jgi:hypothetical protein
MKKITARGNVFITSEETDIRLCAGHSRMVLEITHPGKRLPLRVFRRALAYREFLTVFDMPVIIYVNRIKIVKLNGKKFRVYRPFRVMGWFIRDIFSV